MPQARTAQTIQIDRYGPPEVLAWTTVALAPLAPRDVRVCICQCRVNTGPSAFLMQRIHSNGAAQAAWRTR